MPVHRVVISSTGPHFDVTVQQHWSDEGYHVTYLPYPGGQKAYSRALQDLHDDLETGEKYAVIAYGEAAAQALLVHQLPMPKLCALVAYYPSRIDYPNMTFPPGLLVQVHLASSQSFAPNFASYSYPDTKPGFAESDSAQFERVSSGLAWSRSLGMVRKGFGIEVDLEKIWDHHLDLEFGTKDAAATMKTMTAEPYVNHVPTLTGGVGARDLYRFYRDFFIPSNPETMRVRLISRTVGVDRIVDEMLVSFTHSQEIPWLLPGVPPTGNFIAIALVSIVCIRGGKLYHEHIYWDQASVLVQAGLLDPTLGTQGFKEKGVERLPVVGGESAQKVVDEESVRSNQLIRGW
ncbi:MAG: hypothetical protein M1833_003503 [Piccolia ochrophora]|nr:MAG: hypothetical protein M1833_003503 [Piccolia ochrophora]